MVSQVPNECTVRKFLAWVPHSMLCEALAQAAEQLQSCRLVWTSHSRGVSHP